MISGTFVQKILFARHTIHYVRHVMHTYKILQVLGEILIAKCNKT